MKKIVSVMRALFVFLVCLAVLGTAGMGWAADITSVGDLYLALADSTQTTITLSGTITLEATSKTSHDLEISRDITISGGIIDGNSLYSVFNIIKGTVNFNGVTFQNTSGDKYAVTVAEAAKVNFNNNTKFINNLRGAVDITAAGPTTFTGVTFQSNSAGTVRVATNTTANFSGGEFLNNSGARAVTSAGTVTFDNNVSFTGNKAGAVSITGGSATFTGGTFSENTATTDGGAVSVTGGEVTFGGTLLSFTNNGTSSGKGGGALYLTVLPKFSGTPSISFRNNRANSGGALYFDASAPLSLDAKYTFENNTTSSDGGGAVYATTLNVSGGTFTGNEAKTYGGAVYGTTVTVSGGTFSGNSASTAGGAVYGLASVTVSNGTFSNNGMTTGGTTTTDGGAVASAGKVDVSGGEFDSNQATGNGGAVNAGATSEVSGGTTRFHDNTATGSGGAFYGKVDVILSGGTFTNNFSYAPTSAGTAGGGAVFALGNITTKIPDNSSMTFDSNRAINAMGGALLSSGDITLKNAQFFGNRAETSGGAVYSVKASSFNNCLFGDGTGADRGNIAQTSGGAVDCGALVSTGSTYWQNTATTYYGGAAYVRGTGNSTITSSRFASNSTNNFGGAIYMGGTNGWMEINTSVFYDNSTNGQRGGALYITGKHLRLNRSTFESNKAKASAEPAGGAAYIGAEEFQAINCTFWDNVATGGNGGALYLADGVNNNDLSIKSVLLYCTFVNNRVGDGRGGALYTLAKRIKIAASAFVGNNTATRGDIFRGGGVISSQGYNLICKFGIMDGGIPNEGYEWEGNVEVDINEGTDNRYADNSRIPPDQLTPQNLFGSSYSLLPNAISGGSAIKAGAFFGDDDRTQQSLNTLALVDPKPGERNPALDRIASSPYAFYMDDYHHDERGLPRPQPSTGNSDIGAYESESGQDPSPPVDPNAIAYVTMSGIPNTMKHIGQTCSLTALVYYRDGTFSGSEPVTWASSKPNVAAIDQYGNLVSLTLGTTVISVTTQRPDTTGKPAVNSHELTVSEEWRSDYDNNIHPDVWKRLGAFNSALQEQGVSLTLLDFDSDVIDRDPFYGTFEDAYGVAPAQVTEITDSMLNFTSVARSGAALKPSISVTLNGASPASARASSSGGGGVLPIRVTYGLGWDEVSALLGRTVTQVDNPGELFGRLNLAFTGSGGKPYVLADNGSEGVSASTLSTGKALSLANGNNGVTLAFDVFLSDANAAGDGKPRLIEDKYLTAPDGAANGAISGTLSLTDTGGGGDSGGGGGCNAAGLGVFAAATAAALFVRRRRRS
jgi:predicted outer membrane repeat protein